MKLITLLFSSMLLLEVHADQLPVDEATANAVSEFLLKHGSMEPDDDYPKVGKVFKGAVIYQLWIKMEDDQGFTGTQMAILKRGDRIEAFPSARSAALSLILSHEEKLNTNDDIRTLFNAIGKVTEVKEVEEGTYHVFDGEDFFDSLSGFVVKLKDGKIQSCKYELKLADK